MFWLPLAGMINFGVASSQNRVISEVELFVIGIVWVIVSFVAYVTIKSRRHFQKKDQPKGVLFTTLRLSVFAGLMISSMLSIPTVIYLIILGAFDYDALDRVFVAIPLAGMFLGLAAGTLMSFVCDILIGLDFQKRRKIEREKRAATIR